jgi:hypothetical protein
MTAAFVHLTGPGMRSRCRSFGARLLAVLALVLPVPLFAALGLSLPLPESVARIAAQLVPFGNPESVAVEAGGAVVLVPGEQPSQGSSPQPNGSRASVRRSAEAPAAAISGPRGASPRGETDGGATAPAGDVRGATPADDGRMSSAPSSSTSPGPTPGGTQSGGGSEPAEPAEPTLVDTATSAANDAVNTATTAVTDTVGPTADTAKGVVDSAEGAATDALGPVKP